MEQARNLPDHVRCLFEAKDVSAQDHAWTEFLDAYSRLILFIARKTPGDHDTVMDRYAFVLERLRDQNYRRLRAYAADGRGRFTTWLTIVIRRLCLDYNRLKHGRHASHAAEDRATHERMTATFLDAEAMERVPDGRALADEELDRKRVLERLNAAIASLNPRDQLLLVFRHQDDRSAREIASLMNLPTPFHVYRRLNQIHAAIRRALEAEPPSLEPRSARATNESNAVQ